MDCDLSTIAICVQAVVLFCGFFLTLKQLKSQSKESQARFWLDLNSEFRNYDSAYTALRPRGIWSTKGPDSNDDWANIDQYLGLFEHCEMLISKKLISKDFFERSYKVPLQNAIQNRYIWLKLEEEKEYWEDLGKLCSRLSIHNPITPIKERRNNAN